MNKKAPSLTADGRNPANHLGCINLVNNGMIIYDNYIWCRISEPSTVGSASLLV